MIQHRGLRFAETLASVVLCLSSVAAQAHAQQLTFNPLASSTAAEQQTEKSLRTALAQAPQDRDLNRRLAVLLELSGRLHAAVTYRRQVLALSTGLPPTEQQTAQLELAIALVEDKNLDDAIALLHAVLQQDPLLVQAEFELGTAYARKDNFASALSAYLAAAKLNPQDAETQLAVAKSLITLLRYSEAEPYLSNAEANHASTFELHLLRGMVYRHTERETQAVAELHSAAMLRPDDADANLQLGEALRQTGEQQAAIPYLKCASTIRPDVAVYFQLATVYRSLGMMAEASETSKYLAHLREAETVHTKIEALNNQALLAEGEGRLGDALVAYKSALALRPRDAKVLTSAALIEARLHHPPEEQVLLQQALTASPNDAGALSELGTMEADSGKTAEAVRHLTQALQSEPEFPQALNSLAVLIARQGDLPRAQFLLQQATESDPTYHQAFRNLGLVYASTNQPLLAERFIRRSITLGPSDSVGWIALGELYLDQKQAKAAAESFQSAVSISPESIAARLLFVRSLILEGEKTAALREVNLILQREPGSPEALKLKAEIPH